MAKKRQWQQFLAHFLPFLSQFLLGFTIVVYEKIYDLEKTEFTELPSGCTC